MPFKPLNMDRRIPLCIRPGDQHWVNAPQAPVRRWPLEREAPESGQVTSLVEYLPGARFPEHLHPNGEEILVLEGVFSEEDGHWPAGSYLRSPAGSRHSPFSTEGCRLFVKLNQFAENDHAWVRLTPDQQLSEHQPNGLASVLLHGLSSEQTRLWTLEPGTTLTLPAGQGGEVLVVQGEVLLAGDSLPALTWLRRADFTGLQLSSEQGAQLLIKTHDAATR